MRHILCRAVGAEWIIVEERDAPVAQHGELAERLGRRIKYRSKRYAAAIELNNVRTGVVAIGEQFNIGALYVRRKNPDILRLAIRDLEFLLRDEIVSRVINCKLNLVMSAKVVCNSVIPRE